jgi:hypothetical protein
VVTQENFVGINDKEANGALLKQIYNQPGKPIRAKITADTVQGLANENLLCRECDRKATMAASVHSLDSKLSNTYNSTKKGRNSRRTLAQKRPKALHNAKKNSFFVSTSAVLQVLLAVMIFICVCTNAPTDAHLRGPNATVAHSSFRYLCYDIAPTKA